MCVCVCLVLYRVSVLSALCQHDLADVVKEGDGSKSVERREPSGRHEVWIGAGGVE